MSSEAFEHIPVGRANFAVADLELATAFLVASAKDHLATAVRISNAYCVALAERDAAYRSVLRGPGVTFPDGVPVSWLMRLRNPRARVVRGPDLFCSVIDQGQSAKLRHFFLGTTPATLARLTAELSVRYPNVTIAGTFAPGFGAMDDKFLSEVVSEVAEAEADIVWVALGTPRQDFLTAQMTGLVSLPCVGVGAAFDFVAGTVREAPVWLRGSGLEWAYRWSREPRRLTKRYVVGNVVFLYSAASCWLREVLKRRIGASA